MYAGIVRKEFIQFLKNVPTNFEIVPPDLLREFYKKLLSVLSDKNIVMALDRQIT